MKKKLCAILITILAFTLFATSAFAAEARWRNVATITPVISANDNSYASVISCLEGTTKIECTLVLYEKTGLAYILRYLVLLPPTTDIHIHFPEQPTLSLAKPIS